MGIPDSEHMRACVVVPIYNHGHTIRATIAAIARCGLPVYLVDDGSDAPTQEELARLDADFPLLRRARLEHNSGKGAAVMHGFALALADGMTHALQIDADGQHDAADIPLFLARAAAHPDAVVCGAPVFDASIPKGRLYGRYITHFWVWIETLSFAIRDSMCGFRLYPLAATCALMQSASLPRRMDFDTAIVVRLVWRGVPVENVPTRVIYPPGGLSHFRMLRDNLRISLMHTVLVCGMLPRLPLLLWRKCRRAGAAEGMGGKRREEDRDGEDHWARIAERGSVLGLRVVAACYRLLGEPVARLLLVPVVAYFLIFDGRARRASADYFGRLSAFGAARPGLPAPGWMSAFRHLYAFAESGLHKFAAS
jgi:glycosyltransferase involved in cell wall biosynthesis